MLKQFYGILCVLGIILPYSQFISWLLVKGVNLSALFHEAALKPISAFAWLDVLLSAMVLLGFILVEGNRLNMKNLWVPILGTISIGVSCGLPLFLLLREIHLEKNELNNNV